MEIRIRDAEPGDVEAALQLMRELAEHEGLASYFQLTRDKLVESCLREPKKFHLLVADNGMAIVGYATYMFVFSPWAARDYMFLDDLYVAREARQAGVGRHLMQRVGEIANERDVDVRWHVEIDNRSAQRFYTDLGAELKNKVIAYWLPDAIRARLPTRR